MAPGDAKALVGKKLRCWWEPTDDDDKTGFAGAYWPVLVVAKKGGGKYIVRYDNGEEEEVHEENLSSNDLPYDFGEEDPLQAGEFCEIHNASKTDPCAWVGRIKKGLENGQYLVCYPFHDSGDERIKAARIRRARVMEGGMWRLLKPHQQWKDGDVVSPLELETIDDDELENYLRNYQPSSKNGNGRAPPAGRAPGGPSGGGGASGKAKAAPVGKAPVASASKKGRPSEADEESFDESGEEEEQEAGEALSDFEDEIDSEAGASDYEGDSDVDARSSSRKRKRVPLVGAAKRKPMSRPLPSSHPPSSHMMGGRAGPVATSLGMVMSRQNLSSLKGGVAAMRGPPPQPRYR